MSGAAAGILVVNRLELMRLAVGAGSLARRTPAVRMPLEKIFRTYRGFDGEAWPAEGHPHLRDDGLAELNQLSAVEDYVRKSPYPSESDIIVLVRGGGKYDRNRIEWSQIGFDVGFYSSEWSHFSVVLNEVIWGGNADLRSFASKLNTSLLFDSISDANALAARHDALACSGEDVEKGSMKPVAIYVHPGVPGVPDRET